MKIPWYGGLDVECLADSAIKSAGKRKVISYAYDPVTRFQTLTVGGKPNRAVNKLFSNTTSKHALELLQQRGACISCHLIKAVNKGEL